jgi:4a-hydroxytetrahydrobiopterin dehydratase
MSDLLSAEAVRERLAEAPGSVHEDGHHLAAEWRFPDFAAALAFLNRAAALCEQHDHHADFELAWGRVAAKLWSHDSGGVTERDLRLATEIASLT